MNNPSKSCLQLHIIDTVINIPFYDSVVVKVCCELGIPQGFLEHTQNVLVHQLHFLLAVELWLRKIWFRRQKSWFSRDQSFLQNIYPSQTHTNQTITDTSLQDATSLNELQKFVVQILHSRLDGSADLMSLIQSNSYSDKSKFDQI